MKISDFGKSGPRVVTAGLTCASATLGATAIQPAAASMTMKTLPGTPDIFALPALVLFCGSLSRRAALSRPLGSAEPPAGRARAFAPDRQRVIYLHELCRRAAAANLRRQQSRGPRKTEQLPCRCKVWPPPQS